MRVLVLFDHGIAVLGFMTNASSSVAAHVLCCQEVSESDCCITKKTSGRQPLYPPRQGISNKVIPFVLVPSLTLHSHLDDIDLGCASIQDQLPGRHSSPFTDGHPGHCPPRKAARTWHTVTCRPT
ncbi:hypothetical protein EV356DRAFT_160942 [Viridothelium virens]|uniref:Uncharacterized protein n=1 Tax=Viridothelium virens TaxID=1048519 RepID=A0A6A6H8P3_VIRVR|nr:hypothetical protein EV356DRAFT_160942 [Viridothelium virens]